MPRRRRTTRRDPGDLVFGTIGWLFADLMFALAMAFLVATTVGQPVSVKDPCASPPSMSEPAPAQSGGSHAPIVPPDKPRGPLHPVPSGTPPGCAPTSASSSPVIKKGLESRPVKMVVQVDEQGLLSGDRSARAALQQKVRQKQELRGRQAGLVMSFGAGQAQGTAIADKANDALKELGDGGYVFLDTVYKPYVDFDAASSTLTVDIYLLKE